MPTFANKSSHKMRTPLTILLLTTLPFASYGFNSSIRPYVGCGTDTRLRAAQVVGLTDAFRGDERRDRGHKKRRGKWIPRRIWSRIVGKGSGRDSSPTPLRMQSVDQETLLETISMYKNDEKFISRNFEELTPEMVLPKVGPSGGLDSEFFDVGITHAPTKNEFVKQPSVSRKQNVSLARVMGGMFENILTGIIVRNAVEEPVDLSVIAVPRGNILSRLLRGRFSTDATVEAGRLIFRNIRISSGTLEIKRMTLNVMGFLPNQRPAQSKTRYPKQFDLHADDLTFSRHDLMFSTCIRNGLQTLLVRILRDRGVLSSSIKVTSLDILRSGKISCKGEAMTLIGAPLSFEVRSGISTSSRGHVLTFPGLEVSLNRDMGLFVPVVPHLDLDVGHNARFRQIEIDGKQKHLRLSASVTITPQSTIRLNDYVQSSEAFAAKFSTDVGQWLTQIGKFH